MISNTIAIIYCMWTTTVELRRITMGKIFFWNLFMREILVMMSCTSVRPSAPKDEPLGTGVSVQAIFLGGKSRGIVAFGIPRLFTQEITLVTSNGIKSRKVEEKWKSMREEATKFERFKRRKPREEQRRKGEEEKNLNDNHRKAERNRARD